MQKQHTRALEAPLMLCAALALTLTLPACSTRTGQSGNTTPAAATDAHESGVEELVVTGSGAAHRPDRQSAKAASDKAHRTGFDRSALPQPAPAAIHAQADALAHAPYYSQRQNTENYAPIEHNPIRLTHEDPVSTFSIDVDTGAYANVRRFLNNHQLPPQDAVRVEELINYFDYDYPQPDEVDVPFRVSTELSQTPWNPDTWLLHIGLKGYEVPVAQRPSANLVFLLDVSGSMNAPDKLPLLKKSFGLLTRQLDADDRISIVVYAGASGVVLEPTPGNEQRTITRALRKLQAGGSTNGAAGIELAYELAAEAFIEGGINRIVLATDGDFNVGTVNFEALKDLAERKRATGVSLTTLGFGTGNYNDHLMEQLADAGNGNYAYIDSQREARKVLVDEITSTLHTIAKDVKIQIEFNPEVVAEYRLIGYENRMLKREDFTNDKVDAGEIGAGHTVTALYELIPAGSPARSVLPLRYQPEEAVGTDTARTSASGREVAFVRLRYKQPDGDVSTQIGTPVFESEVKNIERSSANLRFSAAVAGFGQLLSGNTRIGNFSMSDVGVLAREALGRDIHGYRREFLDLVSTAGMLFDDDRGSADRDGKIALTD